MFKYLLASIITTIIATVATTPISVATFNRFSAQNILGNLIIVPLTSFLIAPLGIANLFLGIFSDILIKPLEIVINIMIKAAQFVSILPGSEIALKTPTTAILSMIIIGGILQCLLITKLRHSGTILIAISLYMYTFVQENPHIIMVPGEDKIVCVIEGNTLYSNSKRQGRNKINAIIKNLGLYGPIHKLDPNFRIPNIKYTKDRGLFIWRNGDMKQLSRKLHPVCPISLVNFGSN
jgi:competence protein ComEC